MMAFSKIRKIFLKLPIFLNINYKLDRRLAGVGYFHDLVRGKLSGGLSVLEGMIGKGEFDNCVFVMIEWGFGVLELEERRERELFWGYATM